MTTLEDRLCLVTGASSGIGAEIARELADRGAHLLLTGRDRHRLDEVARALHREGRPAPRTVVADLSTGEGVQEVLAGVGDRPVEVLVNNAGFATYGEHATLPADREAALIAVNCTAVVALTRALLPGMLARGSGGVLNVASTIAFQAAPRQATYGASKAFVLSYTEALAEELRGTDLSVTVLCPGPTQSGFLQAMGSREAGTSLIYRRATPADRVARKGVDALLAGRVVKVVGVSNAVLTQSGRTAPRAVLRRVSGRLLRPEEAAISVSDEVLVAAPPEAVWEAMADVASWPEWYRACRWTRDVDPGVRGVGDTFTWKAHPVVLHSRILEAERGRAFRFDAKAPGLRADHLFTLHAEGTGTRVCSVEVQSGALPWAGRAVLRPSLVRETRAWLTDLAAHLDHEAVAQPQP